MKKIKIENIFQAQSFAIEWQKWVSEQNLSIGELIDWNAYFIGLADKFPELTEEFKDNGII
jgi:hypothetical protein